MKCLTMKWSERTAQVFRPGMGCERARPARATERLSGGDFVFVING
jgi:hypothetical protein